MNITKLKIKDSKKRSSQLEVEYKPFIYANSDVKIKAQFFDATYAFDATANLQLSLINDNTKETTKLPFTLKNNNYEIVLSNLNPGNYNLTVTVDNYKVIKKGKFTISKYDTEQQFVTSNVKHLKSITELSKGNFSHIDETDRLLTSLLSDKRYNTIQKSTEKIVSLIEWKLLLGLSILFLSLEWFIRKYRGLIAFISDPPPPRIKDEDAKADWVKECKDEIDRSIKSQDITEVSKISGIGQTFKAINHHIGKLTHCWLIFSPQSGVNVDIINYFFEKITNKSLTPNFVKIDDPNDSKHIKEKIDSIYKNLPGDLKATDIIADITAGNKPMTTGMILSCLHSERNIEYIEQSERRALIEVDIRPKLTGVELEGK